jgi:hypothetical protein
LSEKLRIEWVFGIVSTRKYCPGLLTWSLPGGEKLFLCMAVFGMDTVVARAKIGLNPVGHIGRKNWIKI